jgi:hypothetical protein
MMRTAEEFEGHWTLHRTIDDRQGRQTGDFRGTATFSFVESGKLRYHEAGGMRFGTDGPVFRAERKYEWQFGEKDVCVVFDDGSAFHSFVPSGQVPGTTHLCGDDLYEVTYDLRDWPVWTATWKVVGPRKDYTSVSSYERA